MNYPEIIPGIYPGWMFNLDLVKALKDKDLSGIPDFVKISQDIVGGDSYTEDVRVPTNEVWLVESISHGDIVPDPFYITIIIDAREVIEEQALTLPLMDISFSIPYPVVTNIWLKAENTAGYTAHYELYIKMRKYTRTSIDSLLHDLGMGRL